MLYQGRVDTIGKLRPSNGQRRQGAERIGNPCLGATDHPTKTVRDTVRTVQDDERESLWNDDEGSGLRGYDEATRSGKLNRGARIHVAKRLVLHPHVVIVQVLQADAVDDLRALQGHAAIDKAMAGASQNLY